MTRGYERCDILCDRYLKDSIKGDVRNDRGGCSRKVFTGLSKFPRNFRGDFLGNGENNEELNHFLASQFMERRNIRETILVVSKGDSILINDDILHSSIRINKCMSEEADARLVRHTIDCVEHGYDRIVVRTVDTDVLILLIGNISYMNELGDATIYALHGSGSTSYYNITEMGLEFGDQISKALPFQSHLQVVTQLQAFFILGSVNGLIIG